MQPGGGAHAIEHEKQTGRIHVDTKGVHAVKPAY
jgi:hypothetical protein